MCTVPAVSLEVASWSVVPNPREGGSVYRVWPFFLYPRYVFTPSHPLPDNGATDSHQRRSARSRSLWQMRLYAPTAVESVSLLVSDEPICPLPRAPPHAPAWLNLTGEALAQAYRDFDLNLDLLQANVEWW